MRSRLSRGLTAFAAAATLACGSGPAVSTTPAPTPSPTPRPSSVSSAPALGASTPVGAVQALIATGGPTPCRPAQDEMWSQSAGCPVTARLQQRLQSGPTTGPAGGADPVCRCQNIAPATVTLVSTDGRTAEVGARFQFAKPLDIHFSVVQEGQGSGWLVDDSSCGDPSTSIYATPVKPCG